ncbi:MAG: NAD-dependent epimerase/dehydratase family protein [Clostridia bacterium]|nr:NAD-dependent epimerase/dehydratase family protein [Clostridia bacterium]
MKVLLVGANGFVGKYLKSELESNGYDVIGTDVVSDDDSIRIVDMLDAKAVDALIEEVKPDYVYNLAGQAAPSISWDKVLLTMHLNIDISVNIVTSCKTHCPNCRILLIGSANQYDESKAIDGVISEDTPRNDTSPYDVSKNAQEGLMILLAKKFDMDIMMTRSFNHIGPGQRTGFVVTDYSKRIVDLERGVIDTFTIGNLNSWKDFSDVRDVVRAYRLIAEKGTKGEIYNVGSGKSSYIRDLIGRLIELSDVAREKIALPERLPDDALTHNRANIDKLKKATGFEPQYDVADTLESILNYYRAL